MSSSGELTNPFFKEQILTRQEVEGRISFMAIEVRRDYTGKNPLFLTVRNGATYFSGVLIREIVLQDPEFRPRLATIRISTDNSDGTLRKPYIKEDLQPDISLEGENVIVLEDIRDRGETIHFLKDHLIRSGADEVNSAVLLERITERPSHFQEPRYVGFYLSGEDWAIGSGLDDGRMGPDGGRYLGGISLNYPPGQIPE
ncbi:MAG TPA: phosphoribosyltransferase family protein [Candidatus Saccharimonadales bacterium]|nr:phosphoribosyltransferase family protein [Candidatus Saccharimonadales bacterium]